MLFTPPRCPRADCPSEGRPSFRFQRRGTFLRSCDGRKVARFFCLHCRKYFSLQSFRVDYRLRRPHLHLALYSQFISKVTMRQAARNLGCNRKTVEHRLRLLGDHCRLFHLSRLERMRGRLDGCFQLDELETFEQDRRLKPLTVPFLIEARTYFVVAAEVATLPARGQLSPRKQARKHQLELLEGRRKNRSSEAVTSCFAMLRAFARPSGKLLVETDGKSTYPGILRGLFGSRIRHVTPPPETPKTIEHPLFPLHLAQAMARDMLSRLVRRTWAHAKKAERLRRHLWMWICYRNYVRGRTNHTRRVTPAMFLGLEQKRWVPAEMLRWRPELCA